MLVQWSDHSTELVSRLSRLLTTHTMLDITLAAEGRFLRAHKVILAASSKYFEDLLTSSPESQPVVFFRSVSFTELESLVDYIYKGRTQVPGSSVQSFLSLATSLGVSGFSEESYKENVQLTNTTSTPTTPLSKKSCSVPASLDESDQSGSASKKRKLFTQSLDETGTKDQSDTQPLYSNLVNLSDQPLYSNLSSLSQQPLYSNLPPPSYVTPPNPGRLPPPYSSPTSLTSSSQTDSQPLYANLSRTLSTPSTPSSRSQGDDAVFKVPLPPKHQSTSSCPPGGAMTTTSVPRPKLSLDSEFLDPDELAAKGATLLHHLAVWMIQQKNAGVAVGGPSASPAVGDAMPPPRSVEEVENLASCVSSSSSHSHSQSLPTRRQEAQSSSFSHSVSRSVVRHGSESDRPDSGFDSNKDEREEEGGAGGGVVRSLVTVKDEAGTSSSPETVREISRQAVARQPLKKKRNFTHH